LNWSSSWFAYTPGTASYLTSAGVPPDKITSVDNAIDTNGFKTLLNSVTRDEVDEKRREFGISEGDYVALYCGSLYPEKRIPYLLQTAKLIAERNPRFRLLIVGSGIETEIVKSASNCSPYILYAGPLFGRDKAVCFRLAELFLNPGLVGLGILDSFCAELPFVTTDEALHSPEIDYLENGVNGLKVSGNANVFAEAVLDLMCNPERVAKMRQAARETAAQYTVENMVAKTCDGIFKSLGLGNAVKALGKGHRFL
jgi:glycosyltransferase involved in cell wall biosynthesis